MYRIRAGTAEGERKNAALLQERGEKFEI